MTPQEPHRRTDWLRELYGILLTAVVLCGLLGILGLAATLTGQPIETSAPSGAVLASDTLVAVGPGVTADGDVELRIEDPSGAQRALAAVAGLPTYLLTTTMLVLLARLVDGARKADPFTSTTAHRLRRLGWLLVVGGPAAAVTEFVARFALSNATTTEGASADFPVGGPALWCLAGVGLLALSEVIRRGQALRAELDTVV
jgi:hypothetical protein